MGTGPNADIEREHETMLQFLYACPAGLVEMSAAGTIILINPVAMKLLLPAAFGKFSANFFDTLNSHAPELRGMADRFPAAGGTICENHRIHIVSIPGRSGDNPQVLSCTLVKLNAQRLMAALSDVTAQVEQERRLRQAEAELRLAEAALMLAAERERAGRELAMQAVRFGAAVNAMSHALCIFDPEGGLIVANARLAEMFALHSGCLAAGLTMELLLASAAPALPGLDVAMICGGIRDLQVGARHPPYVCKLSDERVLAIGFNAIKGEGWLVTFEDITERMLAEAKIRHISLHDALTGLPNRTLFNERLNEALQRSSRGEPSAILHLDLDHFKALNDTLGRPATDAILREIGQRLRQQVREIDTVARLGSDEFAIVQSGMNSPQDTTALAKRLLESLSLPFEINGRSVIVGASIGVTILPDDGLDPVQILRHLDMAVQAAKSDGRGGYRFFEQAMLERRQSRISLEADLRAAITKDEFEVYYQPLVNIQTRSVSGFEALLRWNHPERGMVSPEDFIPLAEEIDLIVPLGQWVLRRACLDAASWPNHLKVAVNVSVVQFGTGTLVDDVAAALAESRLDPGRLDLEVTETVMLDASDRSISAMHKIRGFGVGIAMDDFGTGYSSLNYLRCFPFSKVKIDRSFISGLSTGSAADAIVTAVTALCDMLGVTAVAEGVETEEQLERLRAGRCHEAQGYFFSRPRPGAEVESMCRLLDRSGAAEEAG